MTHNNQPIVRPAASRILTGAAAALASRTGISARVLRAGFVLTSFFGGLGIIAYALATVCIRSEGEGHTPFQAWIARFGRADSLAAKAGWWLLTAAGLAGLAVITYLQGPFVFLALGGIATWLMLDPSPTERQAAWQQ
jgi:phage shock protein PspC (stress-responsive transcriptional regulator)